MAAAATAEHRPSEGTRGSRPTSCRSESEAASHAIAPGGGVGRQPARPRNAAIMSPLGMRAMRQARAHPPSFLSGLSKAPSPPSLSHITCTA